MHLVLLGLAILGFHDLPEGALRNDIWVRHSMQYALLIYLQTIPGVSASTHVYNRLRYLTSTKVPIAALQTLRPDCRANIQLKLETRGPGIVLAALTLDGNRRPFELNTYTFPICMTTRYPSPSLSDLEQRLIDSILRKGGTVSHDQTQPFTFP